MPDYRHERRQKFFQQIFSCTFSKENTERCLKSSDRPLLVELLQSLPEIDQVLETAAPERPLHDINKVDLAILRMIVFESHKKKTPHKVLINEAIELAKEFGSESSPRFINGVLAKLLLDPVSKNE